MRVLVVEDEVDLARALARGLRANGFDVDVVHDGQDGLWRAREHFYGAIVLDLLLPGMNGYRVCRSLRDEGIWTPILVLPARGRGSPRRSTDRSSLPSPQTLGAPSTTPEPGHRSNSRATPTPSRAQS